jgi:outer membrane receptor protein involved in Fe transport
MRISAGKGYRTPDAVSENSHFLASSKTFVFNEDIQQEKAWNYGISFVNKIPVFNRDLNLNIEFFRTDFINQLVVDMDQNSQFIHFYNLKGESYSNTFQIEGVYDVFNRFDLTAAYRINCFLHRTVQI